MAADVVFVVDDGMEIITDILMATPPVGVVPKWVDMGTGATPATATDTVLQTPGAEARTVCVSTQQTTTVTNDTIRYVGTIVAAAPAAIVECALFRHLTTTTTAMFLRATFDAINLLTGNSIEFTVNVKFDQG